MIYSKEQTELKDKQSFIKVKFYGTCYPATFHWIASGFFHVKIKIKKVFLCKNVALTWKKSVTHIKYSFGTQIVLGVKWKTAMKYLCSFFSQEIFFIHFVV